MDSGRCRRCGRPYTAGEVIGMGVLRPRPASEGGPLIDFTCPDCRTVNRLVPHGHGRYAPPGVPPPPPPTDQERRAPWTRRPESEPARGPEVLVAEEPLTLPPAEEAPPSPAPAPEEILSPMEAAAILGVRIEATAEEIEHAFREKALLCHPDKVAHLDPDFVALAERKFRRLRRARDLFLGDGESTRTPEPS